MTSTVGFHPIFSRHGIADANVALLIWLNEKVGFHPTFSRHGIADASIALLIWLNEKVHCLSSDSSSFLESPQVYGLTIVK